MRRRLTLIPDSLSARSIVVLTGCGGGSGGGRARSGSSNSPPQPAFTVTPTSGPAPLSVDFDGSSSNDVDGTITTYAWNFGDGTAGSGRQPRKPRFANSGTFTRHS